MVKGNRCTFELEIAKKLNVVMSWDVVTCFLLSKSNVYMYVIYIGLKWVGNNY